MNQQIDDAEIVDERPAEVAGTALAHLTRAEIDQQIATAKTYPRMLGGKGGVLTEAKGLATMSQEVAESCIYTLPRAGKNITGPSVRLAEIMAYSWGNLRAGTQIVDIDEQHVTCRGFCHDLQKNVMVALEVKRKITGKNGRKFSEDMITVTGAAGCSVALRNAIFRVIPRAYVMEVYNAARLTAIGTAATLSDRRIGVIDRLKHYGVTEARVLGRLGKNSVADVDLHDLETLIGLGCAIKAGDLPIEEAFPEPRQLAEAPSTSRTEQVAEALPSPAPPADRPVEAKPARGRAKYVGQGPILKPESHEVGASPDAPVEGAAQP